MSAKVSTTIQELLRALAHLATLSDEDLDKISAALAEARARDQTASAVSPSTAARELDS